MPAQHTSSPSKTNILVFDFDILSRQKNNNTKFKSPKVSIKCRGALVASRVVARKIITASRIANELAEGQRDKVGDSELLR